MHKNGPRHVWLFFFFNSSVYQPLCSVRFVSTDHKSGNTSLDILLALLQAEGAKIEEETEVSLAAPSPGRLHTVLAENSVTDSPALPLGAGSSATEASLFHAESMRPAGWTANWRAQI